MDRQFSTRAHGLVDSSSLDQSQAFQDFINVCIAERYVGVVTDKINCAGATIWANSHGAAGDGAVPRNITGFKLMGAGRANTAASLFNIDLRIGDNTFLNNNASGQIELYNLDMRGAAISGYNIEGTLRIQDSRITAETAPDDFYTNIGNPKNPDSITGQPFGAMIDLIDCNHPLLIGVNIQGHNNNYERHNAAGLQHYGASNITMIGGRFVHAMRGFVAREASPNSNGSGFTLTGVHFERIRKEQVWVSHMRGGRVHCHHNGSPSNSSDAGWDCAYPMIRLDCDAQSVHVAPLDADGSGKPGTGLLAVACDGLLVGGAWRGMKTAVDLRSGVRGFAFESTYYQESITGPAQVIAPGATRFVSP